MSQAPVAYNGTPPAPSTPVATVTVPVSYRPISAGVCGCCGGKSFNGALCDRCSRGGGDRW